MPALTRGTQSYHVVPQEGDEAMLPKKLTAPQDPARSCPLPLCAAASQPIQEEQVGQAAQADALDHDSLVKRRRAMLKGRRIQPHRHVKQTGHLGAH